MTLVRLALAAGILATLTACATVKESPVSAPLAPMPEPPIRPGFKFVTMRDGKTEVTTTFLSEDAATRSWRDSEGCAASTPKPGFGPAVAWSNCFGSTGSSTAKLEGEVYPLTVGKQWSFTYSGSNNRGNTWSGTRKCRVDAAVRISSHAFGEQDTYKVSCSDHFSRYTFYQSPAQKWTLRSEQYNNDGSSRITELLRIE